ncbi:hypothetical protein [Rhizobium sullae]|uniref:hypothetical protein n=1 Tax=Rhizobium sullae TaxID=50338 RepID=UPI000B357439|nr:hypothetical protein [Rhizobium sullae]
MSIPYPPDAFLAELGRFVSLSSQLELQFDMLFISEVIFRGSHSGRVEEIRASKLMGMPLDKRIVLIRKVFEVGQAKIKLPFAELQPTLNRYAAARKARDKLSHGQLTLVMDKDGKIDPQAAQLMYKSWKAKGDWIMERVTVADLQAVISDGEVLLWEFFDIKMGTAPRSKGSASARVLGQKQAANSSG